MTDEEVVAAAPDPDAQPLTPEQLAKMRRVSRAKLLRQLLGTTQTQFAEAFHLPITTLRDWAQHRSTPPKAHDCFLSSVVLSRAKQDSSIGNGRIHPWVNRHIFYRHYIFHGYARIMSPPNPVLACFDP
jgi:putative transcriptional regulator